MSYTSVYNSCTSDICLLFSQTPVHVCVGVLTEKRGCWKVLDVPRPQLCLVGTQCTPGLSARIATVVFYRFKKYSSKLHVNLFVFGAVISLSFITVEDVVDHMLTLWRPLLPYGHCYKTSCVVICNFWHPRTLMLSPEHHSTRISKITNYGTGCFFIAVPIW